METESIDSKKLLSLEEIREKYARPQVATPAFRNSEEALIFYIYRNDLLAVKDVLESYPKSASLKAVECTEADGGMGETVDIQSRCGIAALVGEAFEKNDLIHKLCFPLGEFIDKPVREIVDEIFKKPGKGKGR